MVMLFSVGCAFDKETGNTFPIMDNDGKIDFDNPVNILECNSEWFGGLHPLDFDIVKNWFADEDLDIEVMMADDEMVGTELDLDRDMPDYDYTGFDLFLEKNLIA